MQERSWRSGSVEETHRIAGEIVAVLPGDAVVLLAGNLGAGKTTLTRGIVQALGGDPYEVTSPTFTLIHEYGDPVLLYHLDLYRLEEPRELLTLGLDEILDAGKPVLIEWGEKFAPLLPRNSWSLLLGHAGGDDRDIVLRSHLPG